MWISLIATAVIGALIYKLFLSNPYKDFWKKLGIFEVDVTKVVKPYEALLGWKPLFKGDGYAYQQMGSAHKFCGIIESGRPVVVIKDLDLAKRLLIKDFDHFVDRRAFFDENDGSLKYMLPSLMGDEWKGVRTAVSPTFTTGKIRRMMNLFNEVGTEWVTEHTRKAKSSGGSIVVDVLSAVNQYTVDVIASAVFGMSSGTIKNPDAAFATHANRNSDFTPFNLIKFAFRLQFPSLANFLGINIIHAESLQFFERLFLQGLKERMRGGSTRHDFLELLVQAKKGELKADAASDELSSFEKEAQIGSSSSTSGKKELLTDDIMQGQSMVFFFAGFSTTSNSLTFTLYALALHPEVQVRLRKEVRTIVKEDGFFDYDDLGKLVYLDMVVCESLRKFSATARIERVCSKDYKDDETGLIVPKGTLVIIPTESIHNDKKYYHNPTEFDPQHFSPERKAGRNPYAYMPFGMGPRNCIGMRFALVEGKAALAHVVHNFRIEPTSKTPIPMQGRPVGLQFMPPKKLELKLTPIKSGSEE